jgi:hypothetical protein
MDKTDIGVFTPPENETDKTTSSELEGQLGVDVARVGTAVGMVPHIPLLPPQSSGVTGGVTEADPDQYLTGHAHPYTSLCENGHTEVLVDGLWYACSICFPSTTRIAPIESETP